MTKKELMKVFEECDKKLLGIRIELAMPNQSDPEIIINTHSSLRAKKAYYNKTYDDNLIHNKNNNICIIYAGPIQIKRAPKRVTLYE